MRGFLLASLLLGGPALAQTFAGMTDTLAAAETLDSDTVGDDGEQTTTWLAWRKWLSLATDAQLRAATDHASPIVRCYAVRGLLAREAKVDWVALMTQHLADQAPLTTRSGCTVARQRAGDVMFEDLRPRLTEPQLLDLAEAMLARKSPLYAREWALRNLRFRDAMLHEVRRLAEQGDGPAAIALARYRLPTDVPLLTSRLQQDVLFDDNTHFLAAEAHADPRLLAPLLACEGKARTQLGHDAPCRLRSWLAAIAVHRNGEAAQFLQRFLRESGRDDPQYRGLVETYAQVLKPYADCTAFAALRAEVAAQRD